MRFVLKPSSQKSLFHLIDQNIEPLELIHSDLCDLKFTPTRGGKKYCISFIDDCTRYYYVSSKQ